MFDWVKIETDEQIKEVCSLAKEIWNEYSICFISQEKIYYMLDKFQSEQAVKGQINYQHYRYYFLEEPKERKAEEHRRKVADSTYKRHER